MHHLQEALRVCDMGLLMGAPLGDDLLGALAHILGKHVRMLQETAPKRPRTDSGEDEDSKYLVTLEGVEFPSILEHHAVRRVHLPSLQAFSNIMAAREVCLFLILRL